MATHGRLGEQLAAYQRRRARPHEVPGRYTLGGAKPQALTCRGHIRELRRRGKDQHHPVPYVCQGRQAVH